LRIVTFDECLFLQSGPFLELLFASNRILNVNELLDIDKKHLVVLLGMAICLLGLMLPNAALEVRSDANVRPSGRAGHNIDKGLLHNARLPKENLIIIVISSLSRDLSQSGRFHNWSFSTNSGALLK